MKTKNLMMMTAATLLMAGCSQNEITDMSPDANPAIGFGVYTGVQTRGAITDNTAIQTTGKGFGICAYLTTSAYATNGAKSLFMDNTQATYNNGSWEYSPIKFWPTNSDKLSFFAYAPYSSTDGTNGITLVDATSAADPLLTFALQAKQEDMVDLVVSESNTTSTIDQTSSSSSGQVSFNLKHVLTRINMKAKTSVDISSNSDTKVYITKVELIHTNKLHSTRNFNMHSGEWAASTNYLASPYNLDNANATGNGGDGILNLTAASFGGYTTASIDISGDPSTPTSLFPSNQYLFLIPINKSTGTASAGDVKVKITYDIVTKTSGSTHAKSTTVKELNLGAGELKQGVAYLYTFTIGLNEIKVTGTVENNWTTTADGTLTPAP